MRFLTWRHIIILMLFGIPPAPSWAGPPEQDQSSHCLAAYERLLLFQEKGPGQLPLTARSFRTDEGEQWIYGVEAALESADSTIMRAAPIVRTLIGQSSEDIEIATSLAGSVTRTGKMGGFSDVDMEALWVVKTGPGREDALNSPRTREIHSLVENFRSHVEKVLRENPRIRFIELKAGEFTDPADGHVKGVKWTLEDIRNGSKTIHEPEKSRTMTLEKAFAENARIKADWAIPSIQEGAPPGAYQEASILYRVGMRVGQNQPRLRPVIQHEVLPLRRTAVAFDPEEARLLREVSQGASSVPLEEIHRKMLESLVKSGAPDPLKLLKRLYALLQFWESPEQVSISAGRRFSRERMESTILEILNDPEVLKVNQLKSQGEVFETLQSHGITAPDQSLETWLKEVSVSGNLHATLETLSGQLNSRVSYLLEDQKEISSYLEILKNRIPLSMAPLEAEASFISIRPDDRWLRRYALKRKDWIKKYPHLHFSHPQDMHMTIHYAGKMTRPMIDRIKTVLPGSAKIWKFTGGGAHIFGRENDVLAISFEADYDTLAYLNTIRSKAVALGAKADLEHPLIDPHVTVARFDPNSKKAQLDRERFLQNETLYGLNSVDMKDIGLLRRDPDAKRGHPVYIPH